MKNFPLNWSKSMTCIKINITKYYLSTHTLKSAHGTWCTVVYFDQQDPRSQC
ncbi:hypothetical protein Plhal304r1_c004g0016131 [Plasmopara halstedii]